MKRILLIVLVAGMVGWAVYQYVDSSKDSTVETANEDEDVGLGVGQTAPDFTLKTIDGEQKKLSEFRGKPVIINFWATWCPPCRAEMPDFQKLYESEDIEILAVNLTESEKNEEVVQEFIDEYHLEFPILMDQSSYISEMYQVQAYPTSFMVDAKGKVQFSARGAINYEIMQEELAKMD